MEEGNNNTRFVHKVAIGRRKNNIFCNLIDWRRYKREQKQKQKQKKAIVEYYTKLYSTEILIHAWMTSWATKPCCTQGKSS